MVDGVEGNRWDNYLGVVNELITHQSRAMLCEQQVRAYELTSLRATSFEILFTSYEHRSTSLINDIRCYILQVASDTVQTFETMDDEIVALATDISKERRCRPLWQLLVSFLALTPISTLGYPDPT
jgi:hypothetical protein